MGTFFGRLKNEMLKKTILPLNPSKAIADYIDYYNNSRI